MSVQKRKADSEDSDPTNTVADTEDFYPTNTVVDSEDSDPTYTVYTRSFEKPHIKRKKVFRKTINKALVIDHMCGIIDKETQNLSLARSDFDFNVVLNEVQKTDIGHLIFMANNINQLYINMFFSYPVQSTSLKTFLYFHAHYKKLITVDSDSLYTLITRKHTPEVYIDAAIFMFTEQSDITTARYCFAHGKKYHMNCKSMHFKDFGMEVDHIENTDDSSIPIAFLKFKESMEQFPGDIQFHLELLGKALTKESARQLQHQMIRVLMNKHEDHELVWQKLAKINCSGIFYNCKTELFENSSESHEERMMKSLETFEIGIKSADHNHEKQN